MPGGPTRIAERNLAIDDRLGEETINDRDACRLDHAIGALACVALSWLQFPLDLVIGVLLIRGARADLNTPVVGQQRQSTRCLVVRSELADRWRPEEGH